MSLIRGVRRVECARVQYEPHDLLDCVLRGEDGVPLDAVRVSGVEAVSPSEINAYSGFIVHFDDAAATCSAPDPEQDVGQEAILVCGPERRRGAPA